MRVHLGYRVGALAELITIVTARNRFGRPITLDALADHYVETELRQLRYGIQQAHLSTMNRWIRPRWGTCLLERITPMAVEQWLRSLPLAPKTKVHLRSLFHLIYQHGRRWELIDINPIELFGNAGDAGRYRGC